MSCLDGPCRSIETAGRLASIFPARRSLDDDRFRAAAFFRVQRQHDDYEFRRRMQLMTALEYTALTPPCRAGLESDVDAVHHGLLLKKIISAMPSSVVRTMPSRAKVIGQANMIITDLIADGAARPILCSVHIIAPTRGAQ